MGPIKKIAQQIRRGKRQFWGLLYPIIQKIKKKSHMDLMSGYTSMAAGP